MKYLLILLLLFSTHSFSGEADGKGLTCIIQKYTYDKKEAKKHFWLNNGKIIEVDAFQNFDKKTDETRPGYIRLPKRKRLSRHPAVEYETTTDEISWKDLYIFTLNRKNLELTMIREEYIDLFSGNTIPSETFKGSCKVFEEFKEVKKIQNQMIEKIKENNLRRKEDEIKAREGNKI